MDKVKSYAITFRPFDGVTDQQVDKILKWIRKACDYYHVVTEKTMAQRHVHAGVFMNRECTRSNIVTRMMQLFPDLSPNEKSVFRNGIKIMYNSDFIGKYLNKDDETVIIGSSLPEAGHMESYFPPKPDLPSVAKAKKCSLYYHELERLWMEHTTPGLEVNTLTVRDFLFNVMYNLRVLPVIRDDKSIIQTARHLVRWLKKSTQSTIELPPFEKEE